MSRPAIVFLWVTTHDSSLMRRKCSSVAGVKAVNGWLLMATSRDLVLEPLLGVNEEPLTSVAGFPFPVVSLLLFCVVCLSL